MAPIRRRPSASTLLFLSLVLAPPILASGGSDSGEGGGREEFTEELLLKPLSDRKVLAQFHFKSSARPSDENSHHHCLFPKAVSQLGFLHIDEYPPDANQGFDIPSALVSFPEFHASRSYAMDSFMNKSPLLAKLKGKNLVQSYTEVLLVPLTTPDFSMPYNVITFTCTVLGLYFGSLLNVLRRRIGEEERLLRNQAPLKRGLVPRLRTKLFSKLRGRTTGSPGSSSSSSLSSSLLEPKLLLKVILVVVIAVIWRYYSNDGIG